MMRWPWVARSRLDVANGVIERQGHTLWAGEALNQRLQAELLEAKATIQRVKPSKVSKNTAKYHGKRK